MGILLVQGLSLPFLLKNSSSDILLTSAFFKAAYADHGQEITIKLHNSSFGSLTSGGGNQISAFASYELNDDSVAGQTINAVMEVNAPNGTLIRTSSYPNGFIAQTAGGVEGLETTIRDPTIQSVIANVTFRNLEKTAMLSNDLRVNLNLADEGTVSTATEESVGLEDESLGLTESEQSPPQPTDQEEGGLTDEDGDGDGDGDGDVGSGGEDAEDEEQDEGQELPLPLFG
jgi:hypothetical protein